MNDHHLNTNMAPSELVRKLCGFCLTCKVEVTSESLRSGEVVAISPSQSCANDLSRKRSEEDPFSTGPLHPPFKACLNQVSIYRSESGN